jgi:hypothetical protein
MHSYSGLEAIKASGTGEVPLSRRHIIAEVISKAFWAPTEVETCEDGGREGDEADVL